VCRNRCGNRDEYMPRVFVVELCVWEEVIRLQNLSARLLSTSYEQLVYDGLRKSAPSAVVANQPGRYAMLMKKKRTVRSSANRRGQRGHLSRSASRTLATRALSARSGVRRRRRMNGTRKGQQKSVGVSVCNSEDGRGSNGSSMRSNGSSVPVVLWSERVKATVGAQTPKKQLVASLPTLW